MEIKDKFKIASGDGVFGTEEASAKIMEQLIDPRGDMIKTVSDITPHEVFGLATLSMYAYMFRSKYMKNWIDNFLRLRVSRSRLGRKEFEIMIAGMKQAEAQSLKGKSFGSLFGGLR